MVVLADTKEIDDVIIQIIDDLDLGKLLAEKHLPASEEWLDIRLMFWDQSNNGLCQAILAADVT